MANQQSNPYGNLLNKSALQINANRYSFLRKQIDKRLLRELKK
jgi:hypothetical protein